MSIPPIGLPADDGLLPNELGIVSDKVESPESQPYLISFKSYNENECELNTGAMNPYALEALKSIKKLGVQIPAPASNGAKVFGVTTEQVYDAHEYQNLFKGLDDPEIDMREIKLEAKTKKPDLRRSGRYITETVNQGRIFFYHVAQTIFIVAFRASHYETLKR